MNTKHNKTLVAIFSRPTPVNLVFADIESLILALGGQVKEGSGSRVVFELLGSRHYLHRPHPGKEARRYQVEGLALWFVELGVMP